MTKTKLIVLTLAAMLLAGGGIAYWHWTCTPTYSLRQIQRAIETHDVAKFEKHVDIQGVSSRLIDDMMSKVLQDTQPQSGAEAFGTAFGLGLIQLMKPRLVEAIREQAIRFVEQGSSGIASSITSQNESGEVSLQSISNKIGAGEDNFEGITYVKEQGKIALVGLGFRNVKLDADLILELKMRDMGGYWQLAEFANFVDLLQEINTLETARLAELNEPIRQKILLTLRIDAAKKSNRSDRWGISKNIDIEIFVRNISKRVVTGFSATALLFDRSGELIKEINIRDEDRIAPSKKGGGVWSIDVNIFDDSDNRLYELPSGQIRFEIAFKRIVFDDGSELKLFESLDEVLQQK